MLRLCVHSQSAQFDATLHDHFDSSIKSFFWALCMGMQASSKRKKGRSALQQFLHITAIRESTSVSHKARTDDILESTLH